jgi:hypothetical protein
MSLKLNLPKWIFLSSAKHFTDGLTGHDVYVEGTVRNLTDRSDWIEIRIDGPTIKETSHDCLIVESEINILVATQKNTAGFLRHMVTVGKVANIFEDFWICKYGEDSSEDDESRLEVFRLKPLDDNSDKIAIANMGQIDPALNLLQTSIEGHYKMIVNKE